MVDDLTDQVPAGVQPFSLDDFRVDQTARNTAAKADIGNEALIAPGVITGMKATESAATNNETGETEQRKRKIKEILERAGRGTKQFGKAIEAVTNTIDDPRVLQVIETKIPGSLGAFLLDLDEE